MHNSCLGISSKYLIFRNVPKPIIDLYGISFLCANFETFTIFSAIVLIDCTYLLYYIDLFIGGGHSPVFFDLYLDESIASFYALSCQGVAITQVFNKILQKFSLISVVQWRGHSLSVLC